jgi:hypothetical protein
MYGWSLMGPVGGLLFMLFGINQGWWMEMKPGLLGLGFFPGFSWNMFFSSISGWALIIWMVTSLALATFYGYRYTKITGKEF